MEKIEVVKLLIEEDGKFLAVQNSNSKKWNAGKWELPGGKLENTEEFREAAKREIKEELGIKIEKIQKVVRTEVEEFNKKPVVDCTIAHSKTFSGDINLSTEHKDFRWVSPDEFIELDWHRDAGYGIPPIKYLEEYLQK